MYEDSKASCNIYFDRHSGMYKMKDFGNDNYSGDYQPTTYQILYFLPDGKGKLEMDNGTVFLPNDLYPLETETFLLYYTSASTDQQTIDIYIIESFGQKQQGSFSFNNDTSEDKK